MNPNQITETKKIRGAFLKNIAFVTIVFGLSLLGAKLAPATLLYATSSSDSKIYQVDTLTGAPVSAYFTALQSPDSLMFDSMGNVIYTALSAGNVRSYNPNTAADSMISSGLSGPADVSLEPGGLTMLVSEFSGGKIDRINLTHSGSYPTTPSANGTNPEGIAYDAAGHLFANLGVRGSFGSVAEVRGKNQPGYRRDIRHKQSTFPVWTDWPTTPLTHMLYAASLYGYGNTGLAGTVYQIDPNNLNNVVDLGATHSVEHQVRGWYHLGRPRTRLRRFCAVLPAWRRWLHV